MCVKSSPWDVVGANVNDLILVPTYERIFRKHKKGEL
jgi:hypothetical protein